MGAIQANAARRRRGRPEPGPWRPGLAALLGLALCCACPPPAWAGEREGRIASLADLNRKSVGILVGSNLDMVVNDHVDFINFEYYDNYDEMKSALLAGLVDAVAGDEPAVREWASEDSRLRVVEEVMEVGGYGFAFRLDEAELRTAVDAAIGELLADGTLDALAVKWLDGPPEGKTMAATASGPGAGRILRMGTSGVLPPFSYTAPDGRVIGFDMEMAEMVAARLEMQLKVVTMDFGQMIPRLLAGEVDMIGGALTITAERERIMSFTRGYYTINAAALVLR